MESQPVSDNRAGASYTVGQEFQVLVNLSLASFAQQLSEIGAHVAETAGLGLAIGKVGQFFMQRNALGHCFHNVNYDKAQYLLSTEIPALCRVVDCKVKPVALVDQLNRMTFAGGAG